MEEEGSRRTPAFLSNGFFLPKLWPKRFQGNFDGANSGYFFQRKTKATWKTGINCLSSSSQSPNLPARKIRLDQVVGKWPVSPISLQPRWTWSKLI